MYINKNSPIKEDIFNYHEVMLKSDGMYGIFSVNVSAKSTHK